MTKRKTYATEPEPEPTTEPTPEPATEPEPEPTKPEPQTSPNRLTGHG